MTRILGSYDDRDVSLSAKDQYFRQVHWIADLPREEEDQLVQMVEQCRQEGAKAHPDTQILAAAAVAIDRLVQGYQQLVIAIARQLRHRFHSMDLMDLIQEGNGGLLRAIEENDASKGLPLKALACSYIRYAICDAWRTQNGVVRCSQVAHKQLAQVLRAEARLLQEQQHEPTLAEIAQAAGLSLVQVHEAQALRQWLRIESLQAYQAEHEERGDDESFSSLVQVSPPQEVRCAAVRHAMQVVLTPQQRQVIALRYGLIEGQEQGMTHPEVAGLLGCSRDNSAHIEMMAERRLRQHLGGLVGQAVICCVVCGQPVPQRFLGRPRRYCRNNRCLWAAKKLLKAEVA